MSGDGSAMTNHNCERKHRTHRALAKCIWPRAGTIHGDGSFAVIARCRAMTIHLHIDRSAAEKAKDRIDRIGCGGRCTRRHEIVTLDIDGP